MTEQILPGAWIGVLGGGQLGRMLALVARRLGYKVSVFAPEADPPAAQVADRHVRASYDDLGAVQRFAEEVAVVTFEFENVPSATAETAARYAAVRPRGEVLHVTQNRAREKQALRSLGLPVADFAVLAAESDLESGASVIRERAVLKSASWGYDGKGQRVVTSLGELKAAWEDLGAQAAVLEAWVPFEREVSVVGARGPDGDVALYDPFENSHANHILDVTISPARVASQTRVASHEMARTILEGLDVVGVLCIEMFLLPDGELVVNELAPRPHNSGHVTIDAHRTSQFEQQLRAICGLPLGSVEPLAPAAAMANLLGDLWSDGVPHWDRVLALPEVSLHLYGKEDAKPGRKMGHLTATGSDPAAVEHLVVRAREALTR